MAQEAMPAEDFDAEYKRIMEEHEQSVRASQQFIAGKLTQNEQLKSQLTTEVNTKLNSDLQKIHKNQQEIDALLATNRQQAQRLIKCGTKWVNQYDSLLSSMNEVGDIVNWSRMIENELQDVNIAIQTRVSGKRQNNTDSVVNSNF